MDIIIALLEQPWWMIVVGVILFVVLEVFAEMMAELFARPLAEKIKTWLKKPQD